MTEPRPGVYVFDMGQNMVGWCRLKVRGPAGTKVVLRHAEMLNDDGTIYTANLRGAAQINEYTLRGGGEEVFEPHFTYHGFRYVEVTGLPARPAPDAIVGRVFHSAAPDAGQFECSNPLINQLMRNIVWTQRANLMSAPTDCPQRTEREGWMGDIQAFSQTAIFNMDMAGFFTKWVPDIRDSQADDGRYPDIAPARGRSEQGRSPACPPGATPARSFPGGCTRTMPTRGCSRSTSSRPADGSISSAATTRTCCGRRAAATTTTTGSTATRSC